MEKIEIGATYKHFKGNMYKVLAIGKSSETLEEYVVYVALYGNGEIWIRPMSMWNDIVERDGVKCKRFTKIN